MAIETSEQAAKPVRSITSGVNWKKYFFEFLSIFFAVILAFALNNWNDNRKSRNTETDILKEISNGLSLDLEDILVNMKGHEAGLKSAAYMRKLFRGEPVAPDSIAYHKHVLLRDYISIQNISGYESLKSQGLDLIKNDSLRLEVIAVYEYHFELVEKFEEQYASGQFFKLYADRLNGALAPNLVFDKKGKLNSVDLPLNLSKTEKNRVILDLNAVAMERAFIMEFYKQVKEQVEKTKKLVDEELASRD